MTYDDNDDDEMTDSLMDELMDAMTGYDAGHISPATTVVEIHIHPGGEHKEPDGDELPKELEDKLSREEGKLPKPKDMAKMMEKK